MRIWTRIKTRTRQGMREAMRRRPLQTGQVGSVEQAVPALCTDAVLCGNRRVCIMQSKGGGGYGSEDIDDTDRDDGSRDDDDDDDENDQPASKKRKLSKAAMNNLRQRQRQTGAEESKSAGTRKGTATRGRRKGKKKIRVLRMRTTRINKPCFSGGGGEGLRA